MVDADINLQFIFLVSQRNDKTLKDVKLYGRGVRHPFVDVPELSKGEVRLAIAVIPKDY